MRSRARWSRSCAVLVADAEPGAGGRPPVHGHLDYRTLCAVEYGARGYIFIFLLGCARFLLCPQGFESAQRGRCKKTSACIFVLIVQNQLRSNCLQLILFYVSAGCQCARCWFCSDSEDTPDVVDRDISWRAMVEKSKVETAAAQPAEVPSEKAKAVEKRLSDEITQRLHERFPQSTESWLQVLGQQQLVEKDPNRGQ